MLEAAEPVLEESDPVILEIAAGSVVNACAVAIAYVKWDDVVVIRDVAYLTVTGFVTFE